MSVLHALSVRPDGRRLRRAALVSAVVTVFAAGSIVAATGAQATTVSYSGISGPGDSLVVTHRGEVVNGTNIEQRLSPTGAVTAVLDDTNHKVLSSTVALDPAYSGLIALGPLFAYVRADFEQIGTVTGTVSHTGTPGIDMVAVHTVTRLHMTTYATTTPVENPATDGTISQGATCFVDLDLTLAGPVNRRTGTLSLGADPLVIPRFPGPADNIPGDDCTDFGAKGLNFLVAGSNNAITLNFKGAPTSAHYTGVTTGNQSTIGIRVGDPIFAKTVHPSSSIVADINFQTGAITNVKALFKPIDIAALPGLLAAIPVFAHIDITTTGTPVASLTSGGATGIDKVNVSVNARMAVTVTAVSSLVKLTNPLSCYVNLKLNLAGTVDRGTDQLNLAGKFTIPSFPLLGCGVQTFGFVSVGLTSMVSGTNNSIALNYVDGTL